MKKLLLVSLSCATLLSGCAAFNNEDMGTLSGGVLGGLIGSQFGGNSGKVVAAAGGALIGAFLGGHIGQYMDRQDKLEMQHALETAPVGKTVRWKNPDNGNQFTVKPTRTYYQEHQPCREYTTLAMIGGKQEVIHGKACRDARGQWRVAN